MADKQNDPTTVVIQQAPPAYQNNQQQAAGASSWKTSGNVRILIISVTVVVLVGLVVTGFTLGFKHHADATEKALTNKQRIVDEDGEETVETDDGGLTKLYTVTTTEGTYYVLYDYNTNLRTVKRDNDCIVMPMNSSETDPQTALEKGLQDNDDHEALFQRDDFPIRDHSFLGKKGQELCDGKLVYWAFPTCDGVDGVGFSPVNTTGVAGGRDKRATQVLRAGPCSNCCITSWGCGRRLCSHVSYVCISVTQTRFVIGGRYYYQCRWLVARC